jgi:hypothetical protein
MNIHARPHAALIDALSARLGRQHVLLEAEDMAGHLIESRGYYRGAATAVVRPANTEEVAFVVRECAAAGLPVVPQGGNTGLVGGGVPYGGVVLSLARLDRIREVDPVNATLTVEAGCILQNVHAAAAEADLLFPSRCRLKGRAASAAIFRPTPAAPASCATAIRANWCLASRWCWPTAGSGTASPACARTTPAMT